MGLGNFLKQLGGGKLPESQLNQTTVLNILKSGAPFIVALPIYDTERSGSYSISKSLGGGYRQIIHNRPPSRKVQRQISTTVTYSLGQLTIHHAQNNGKHIFIKTNQIAKVGKLKNGILIELDDGTQYKFLMDNNIQNKWKKLGFNPQFPIDVFYNLLLGRYQRKNQQNVNKTQKVDDSDYDFYKDPVWGGYYSDHENNKKKTGKKIPKKQLNKHTEDNSIKVLKNIKELLDMGAISQDDFINIKTEQLKNLQTSFFDDTDSLDKIKKYKELFDLNIITQEEFNDLKDYLLSDLLIGDADILTKKCNYCGTMNLPSELYCIKCGAFLNDTSSYEMDLSEKEIKSDNWADMILDMDKPVRNTNKEYFEGNPIELLKKIQELLNTDAINLEEYTKLKIKYLNGIKTPSKHSYEDHLENLKKYKELLDLNIITQEEYDIIKDKHLKNFLNQPEDEPNLESNSMDNDELKDIWDGTSYESLYPTPSSTPKTKKKEKSKAQIDIEKSARRATKGIMRGTFGQKK